MTSHSDKQKQRAEKRAAALRDNLRKRKAAKPSSGPSVKASSAEQTTGQDRS